MRLKWNKCNHNDIAEALKTVENMYNADITCTNVYFRLKKGDIIYSLYDMSTFEEATITMSNNMIFDKKIENLVCISGDNIEVIKAVMHYIQNWSEPNRKNILNFLISKLAILTNTQKSTTTINNIEKIEEVVVLLFNSIGISPAEILMPYETQAENEIESIENKLNFKSDSNH